MEHLTYIHTWIIHHQLSNLFIVGEVVLIGFFLGRTTNFIKLPSIIGYMLVGVILGPSLLDIINHSVQKDLSFITDIALGFVALSIGLELSMKTLKTQGIGIIMIIICESLGAFIITSLGLYFLTGNLPLSLIFGAFAPASAPAGTVAVIKEYKAKGSLTKALYAVVGFDDGLAIIIFGFTAAVVKMLLLKTVGTGVINICYALLEPLKEILLSLVIGIVASLLLSLITRKAKTKADLLILTVSVVLLSCGLCIAMHLSLILTNMVIGFMIVNTQKFELVNKLSAVLGDVMPFFFVIFFALAGANLHIASLPTLGAIGIIYILCRTTGLIGGSVLGGIIGKADSKLTKYVGLGILSQAGVAIGLALMVKQEFQGMGGIVHIVKGIPVYEGDIIGTIGITTITATCLFFELIGPVLTKLALSKAGEIN